MLNRLITVWLGLALLAGALQTTAAHAQIDPSQVALTQSDVGDAYHPVPQDSQQIDANGFHLYTVVYQVSTDSIAALLQPGPLAITNVIVAGDRPVSASTMDTLSGALMGGISGNISFQPTDGPPLGDSTQWFVATSPIEDTGINSTFYLVTFIVGNTGVITLTGGFENQTSQNDAVHYSQTVATRIQAAMAPPAPSAQTPGPVASAAPQPPPAQAAPTVAPTPPASPAPRR